MNTNTIPIPEPRPFDTYILPGFMVYYAIRSKGMPRLARRMLFISGVLMAWRSIDRYRQLLSEARTVLAPGVKNV